jgi:hypothetical protein
VTTVQSLMLVASACVLSVEIGLVRGTLLCPRSRQFALCIGQQCHLRALSV